MALKIKTVKKGEIFKIEMRTRGGTGYSWKPKFDSPCMTLIQRYTKSASNTFGGSSLEVFEFLPSASNEDIKLKFNLSRPWEDKSIEQEEYLIHVD